MVALPMVHLMVFAAVVPSVHIPFFKVKIAVYSPAFVLADTLTEEFSLSKFFQLGVWALPL